MWLAVTAFAIVVAATAVSPTLASAAPIPTPDQVTATEDTTLSVPAPGLLGNDTDLAQSLEATLASGSSHGTVDLAGDGSFSYVPDADFNGVDQFSYRAWDGSEWSESATVTITVLPVPDPTRVLTSSKPSTLARWGASYRFAGKLLTAGGRPVANRRLTLQASSDGKTFRPANASALTAADGSFSFRVVPSVTTWYRASFAGAATEWQASVGAAVRVVPRPKVSAPAAPSLMYQGRRETLTVGVTPRHKAGSSVRIYKYRRVGSRWKSSGYVKVTTRDGVHYSGSVPLPGAGRWKLRSYSAADGGHGSAWSGESDYVLVKTRGQLAVAIARKYLGRPYVSGGEGPHSFDCSGLVHRAYASAGIHLPRYVSGLVKVGPKVSTRHLKPGDLVFYYRPPSHVGIYVGGGKMIDSNHPGGSVGIRRLYPGLSRASRPWDR